MFPRRMRLRYLTEKERRVFVPWSVILKVGLCWGATTAKPSCVSRHRRSLWRESKCRCLYSLVLPCESSTETRVGLLAQHSVLVGLIIHPVRRMNTILMVCTFNSFRCLCVCVCGQAYGKDLGSATTTFSKKRGNFPLCRKCSVCSVMLI